MAHQGSSLDRSGSWQQAWDAAAQETDPKKLAALLAAVEGAVFTRLQELGPEDSAEREAIATTLVKLRRLQVTRLKFPEWEARVRKVS